VHKIYHDMCVLTSRAAGPGASHRLAGDGLSTSHVQLLRGAADERGAAGELKCHLQAPCWCQAAIDAPGRHCCCGRVMAITMVQKLRYHADSCTPIRGRATQGKHAQQGWAAFVT